MSCALSAFAEPLLGSRSARDLRFMNPTGAPEPLGDSGRIVWGIFVFDGRCAREHPWVQPPSPRVIRAESFGGFCVLQAGEFLFCQRVRASAPASVAPEPGLIRAESSGGCCQRACVRVFSVEAELSTRASLRHRGVYSF